jgi:hypothetical protein
MSRGLLLASVMTASMLPLVASAQTDSHAKRDVTLQAALHPKTGDGTMNQAAAAAMARGALPKDLGEVSAKKAASTAPSTATRSTLAAPAVPAAPAAPAAPKAPAVQGGHNFGGQFDSGVTPSDSTGSIGTTRYIQTVNRKFAIYNRSTNALINTGTLNQLANAASGVSTFDPQIMWDPQTTKFFYTIDAVVSVTDNELAFGFSKTASPSSAADFCHYFITFGSRFPDYPKLGDSTFFTIIGVNAFDAASNFLGSDLLALSKPAAGTTTTCPAASTFAFGGISDLRDTANNRVFTPVPANGYDTVPTGYVVARNGALPATKLWFFNVTRNASTGAPVFGAARGLTVNTYTLPANAGQGGGSARKIDTSDARNTQAVLARNPDRGNALSFWTQHTIANGSRSVVRWYEINPVPATPTLLRSGSIGGSSPNTFFFNASIAPDRRVDGATTAFGDSFVIQYSVSSSTNNINPRIVMSSSFNGGAVSSGVILISSAAPYVDFSCSSGTGTCRWGDYSAAVPDPRPGTTDRGVVWSTNQFGNGGASTSQANWRIRIWAATP